MLSPPPYFYKEISDTRGKMLCTKFEEPVGKRAQLVFTIHQPFLLMHATAAPVGCKVIVKMETFEPFLFLKLVAVTLSLRMYLN